MRKALSSAIAVFIAAAVLAGCRKHASEAKTTPPLRIAVAVARLDSIAMRYTFVSHLSSNYDAVIQPRVNGYLKTKNFSSGLPVRRGDLLFVIDDNLLLTTMRAAQAGLASAQALELEAKNNYERAVPLAGINAISRSQLDQYTAQYASARSSVQSARQSLENARLQVGYARIYSPIDGIISKSAAHEGDYVGPGTSFATLATVSNIDTLSANIAVPTSLYMRYAGRDNASYDNEDLLSQITLYLANGDRYPYEGVYDYTQQNISPSSGTISLVVNFPNPQYKLKAGEYAKIETTMGGRQGKILIPQQCVSQIQGTDSVWIIRGDSTAEYRPVTLGDTYGGMWIVEEGIAAGETVAVTGSQKLRNGAKVDPYVKQ